MQANDMSLLLMQSLYLMLWLSMPSILVATTVGITVSIFQALTQIQEQTLSFAMKLMAIGLCLFFLSSWMGMEIYRFSVRIFDMIPYVIK